MSDIIIPPRSVSVDDEHYKQLIRYRILQEAYNRDYTANRPNELNNQTSNTILLTEIQSLYPASGNIEEFRREARGMSMKDDPLIKFVRTINDDDIRITDRGRTFWEDNRRVDYKELDL